MSSPHREQHDGYLARYLESGLPRVIGFRREIPGLKKDGTVFPIEIGVTEIGVGNDRVFVGILRDITARKKAEEEIRELNASLERRVAERTAELRQLGAIIDASTDLVAMKTPDGRLLLEESSLPGCGWVPRER